MTQFYSGWRHRHKPKCKGWYYKLHVFFLFPLLHFILIRPHSLHLYNITDTHVHITVCVLQPLYTIYPYIFFLFSSLFYTIKLEKKGIGESRTSSSMCEKRESNSFFPLLFLSFFLHSILFLIFREKRIHAFFLILYSIFFLSYYSFFEFIFFFKSLL